MKKSINDFLSAWAMLILYCILFGYGGFALDRGVSMLEKKCLMPYAINYPRCQGK